MAAIKVNGRSVLGMDVGKRSHWACLVTPGAETPVSRPVANDERELSELMASVPEGTLVVVDQKRNIGALPLRMARARGLDREISGLLEGDATYRCLQTVPGIGPRTASELVIAVDIDDFPDHDHLASYCGVAPRNRQSGTSISSVSASRQGNKRLKNLLIFSCNSLCRSRSRFGDYYGKCRGRGMCHGEALKATARKRLKVIYAVMRDRVPYTA